MEVLAKAKESEFSPELRNDIAEAENVFGQLEKLDGYQHREMKMNKATIIEIRSYARPKPIIFDTMKAVCFLIGENWLSMPLHQLQVC